VAVNLAEAVAQVQREVQVAQQVGLVVLVHHQHWQLEQSLFTLAVAEVRQALLLTNLVG
jgi:hypothetical protein